jgi:hypothetical protein
MVVEEMVDVQQEVDAERWLLVERKVYQEENQMLLDQTESIPNKQR